MPISAEDPYASMEKDQVISMIHRLFLTRGGTSTGEPRAKGYGLRA